MGETSLEPQARRARRTLLFIAAVFVVCAARVFWLVADHGVNLIVMDQFDFLVPLFDEGYGPLDKFRFQFRESPHRMGAGWPVVEAAARLSGWNTRADGYAIALVLCAATGLALWLKRRLSGRLQYVDASIPLLLLTTRQWTTFIGTPDASLGAVPVLLLVMLGLALTIRSARARVTAVLVVDVLCIYTGFALFAGLIVPVLVLREGYAGSLSWPAAAGAFTASLLFGLSYFIGFDTMPVTHPVAMDLAASDYLSYATNLFVSFFAVRSPLLANLLALVWPLLLGLPLVFALRGLWKREPAAAASVVALFSGFGLIFVVANTLGRIGEGAEFAFTPRYLTLMLPGMLGLYFAIHTGLGGNARNLAAALFGLTLLASEVVAAPADREAASALAQSKRAWKACYLETRDLGRCNVTTGSSVYPWKQEYPRIEMRLRQLEERKLNLFAPADDGVPGAR